MGHFRALELCPGLEKFPDRVFFKKWNPAEQAKDTPVEQMSSQNLNRNDYKNWKGGDLLRIVVLYKYGGLYFDLDSLLLRDLTPLFNQDFVYQWPCIEQDATNGAFMFSQRPGVRYLS
jgi:mannosyltransferase OCH1-like enzyme